MNKIKKALNQGGLTLLTQRIFNKTHNQIRSYLPQKTFTKAGLKFKGRLLDYHNTSQTVSNPHVKWQARHAVQKYVKEQDKTGCIGSGEGLTATHLAKKSRHVTIFEPAQEMIQKTQETLFLNNQTNFEIKPVLFGEVPEDDSKIWGNLHPEIEFKSGKDLNHEFDVLEMDCEGAELEILQDLKIRPRVLIVEVHMAFGVSRQEVVQELESMGYEIQISYSGMQNCRNDILVAVK